MLQIDSDSYQMGRELGTGTYGTVVEAMNQRTGEMVAIKLISLRGVHAQHVADMARQEMEILRQLRHPHVVSVKGIAFDSHNVRIVMELVSGQSLSDMVAAVGALSESVMSKFAGQLCDALAYCHERGCVHRDIKGKNILVATDGNVRICGK